MKTCETHFSTLALFAVEAAGPDQARSIHEAIAALATQLDLPAHAAASSAVVQALDAFEKRQLQFRELVTQNLKQEGAC